MSITIDGVKYSSKDIEGTDLEAVKKFCQKNKVKAATIIYVDKSDNVESCRVWFNRRSGNILDKYLRYGST